MKKRNGLSGKMLLMAALLSSQLAVVAKGDDGVTMKVNYAGATAKVSGAPKGVKVSTNGANVIIDNTLTDKELIVELSGRSSDGSLTLNGSHKSTVALCGVELKSTKGAAIELNCGKRMKLKLADGKANRLEDAADTLHKACINTRGHLEISGGGTLDITANSTNAIRAKEYIEIKKSTGAININSATGNGISTASRLTIDGGMLNINLSSIDKRALKSDSLMTLSGGNINAVLTGDGGKGIKCGADLVVTGDVVLNVKTSGSYVAERQGGFGGFGGFPGMGEGMPDFGGFPPMGEGMPDFAGGFPGFGEGMPDFGGFPPMDGGMPDFAGGFPGFGEGMPDFGGGFPPMGGFGGFGGGGNNIEVSETDMQRLFADVDDLKGDGGMGGFRKMKYDGSAKAVKVMGTVYIQGGDIRLETAGDGAEGLEGKQGVEISGGKLYVKACDDAISSNGKILISGGDTFVWSLANDAIDSNYPQTGAITISGGKIVSCSQTGPPEEAFDCDFSPLVLTGGIVFGMGGSMMGEATAPADAADTQPTVVLNGLPLPKGKTLVALDENQKELFSLQIPFSVRASSSILSLPEFAKGKSYSVKIKQPDVELKKFTFDATIAR